jgi:hypothetical protein
MKHKLIAILLTAIMILGLSGVFQAQASVVRPESADVGGAFTYEGQLIRSGQPYNGVCDFVFTLWDAENGGAQVGATQLVDAVVVDNGLFVVLLNAQGEFGAEAFVGLPRWLEIAMRCPAGSGEYTTLDPRQPLTPTPYAMYSATTPWDGLTSVPAGFADGIDNDTLYTAGPGLILTDTEFSLDEAYVGTVVSETIINNPSWFSTVIISNTNLLSQTFQLTIEGECPAGSAIRQVNEDGTVVCEADDNTLYTAGDGLTLLGTEFSLDYMQVITEILPLIITATHPSNLVIVAKSGGDFTSIQAAIDSITDPADDNPYTVFVAPGRYAEIVTMQSYISLVGSSRASTIITAPGGAFPFATVTTAANAELSALTIQNTGGTGKAAVGVYVPPGANTTIHNVAIQTQNGDHSADAVVYIDAASPSIYDATLVATDNSPTNGIIITSNSSPSITNLSISLDDSASVNCGICVTGSGGSFISNLRINISMSSGGNPVGISSLGATSSMPLTIYDTDITVSGGNIATGVYAGDSNVDLVNVNIDVSGATINYGIRSLSSGPAKTIQVDHCVVRASTNAYYGDAEYTVLIGETKLLGGLVNKNGGTATCAGVYDEAFVFYPNSCP